MALTICTLHHRHVPVQNRSSVFLLPLFKHIFLPYVSFIIKSSFSRCSVNVFPWTPLPRPPIRPSRLPFILWIECRSKPEPIRKCWFQMIYCSRFLFFLGACKHIDLHACVALVRAMHKSSWTRSRFHQGAQTVSRLIRVDTQFVSQQGANILLTDNGYVKLGETNQPRLHLFFFPFPGGFLLSCSHSLFCCCHNSLIHCSFFSRKLTLGYQRRSQLHWPRGSHSLVHLTGELLMLFFWGGGLHVRIGRINRRQSKLSDSRI